VGGEKMLDDELTTEQNAVVDFMSAGKSPRKCIVQAFAGCGKTTLLARLAERRFQRNLGSTLLLTYSAELKNDTRKRAHIQEGLFVESIHSVVRNILYVGHDCKTDADIEAYLALDVKPKPNEAFLEHITLVVLDEMQDLSPLYYRVVQQLRSFFIERGTSTSLVGVGDFFQWLFGSLNGSTPMYMCSPDEHFEKEHFETFVLSKSFRLTQEMCNWINKNLDPRKMEFQYPICWAKYGASITKYWRDGLCSAKCAKCACVHDPTTSKCKQNYNTKSIREREVIFFEIDTFKNLLPPFLYQRAKSNNALVIVNGFRRDKFVAAFPNVTSPWTFKGCQTRNAIVIGCDAFTEEVCASSENAEPEEWPFACYCQMYVSATRAQHKLFIGHSKSKPRFFTMRNPQAALVQTPTIKQKAGKRSIARLFDFVPEEDSKQNQILDAYLSLKPMEQLGTVLSVPCDVVQGKVYGTLTHRFSANYYRAIIIATYVFFTTDTSIENWTEFMHTHILKEQSKTMNKNWVADTKWCKQALTRCISLLQKASLEVYGKCFVPFTFAQLTGIVHFSAHWGAMVQVIFDRSRKSLHEAMTNFLCFRQVNPTAVMTSCYALRPLQGDIVKLELNVDPQYYLNRITERKKWSFLLPSSFSLESLHACGVYVPEKQLHQEHAREQQMCKKQKTGQAKTDGK
jgi:hypothetical protein